MKEGDFMKDDELKVEKDVFEYEEYEKSGSEDDFSTWKLKQYIDKRLAFIEISLGFIVVSLFLVSRLL
jgi:hypothetical protein